MKDKIIYDEPNDGIRVLYRKNGASIQPGLENTQGKVIWFPPRSELSAFREGMAIVEEHIPRDGYYESRSGVINQSGEWIIEQKYHQISYCGENRFYATTNSGQESFLLDANGSIINRYNEEYIPSRYNEGLMMICRVSSDLTLTHYSYINLNGDKVISDFPEIGINIDFENNICCNDRIRIFHQNRYGYVDKTNQLTIPCEYDYGTRFNNNLAAVEYERKYGFIDCSGQVQIPFDFDEACSFNDGLARVKRKNKWGMIDEAGNIVVPFVYDEISMFSGEVICAKKNNKWGIIDADGNIIVSFKYEEFGRNEFLNDLIVFKNNGKFGVVDRNMTIKIQAQYDVLRLIHNRLFYFERGSFCGICDIDGAEIESEELWGSEMYAIG